MHISAFIQLIKEYYALNRRSFSWREEITPYRIFISEVMLQQTQTYRVEPKFEAFVQIFPSFEALAQAPFGLVLEHWKGLGYNRRALNLQRASQLIVDQYNGQLPDDPILVDELPGIGPATAASITCFAYNKPTVFIETNVRTVYLHHFFPGQLGISDQELMPLVEQTVDQENPRDWYYALMDYGVHLKKTVGNVCRASKHYSKQSAFIGSNRQIRGAILEQLIAHKMLDESALCELLPFESNRIAIALEQLIAEKIVKIVQQQYTL